MKRFRTKLILILLLALSVLLFCTACTDPTIPADTDPYPSDGDTTVADTPADPQESAPDGTDAPPADTDTPPDDTAPAPDGIHIPDPSVSVDYTPKDGVIVGMGVFDGKDMGDTVGYASVMMAGGEVGSYEVTFLANA